MRRGNEGSTIKKVYDDLATNGFAGFRLSQLLDARFLENTLWPEFQNSVEIECSLLICFLLDEKKARGLSTFGDLGEASQDDRDARISKLIDDILLASLDNAISFKVRTACLSTLIDAALNLDDVAIQRIFQSLVSILTWQHITPARREDLFESTPVLRKRYKSRTKALQTAEASERARLSARKDYLSHLVLDVIVQLNARRSDVDTMTYCCRAIELFTVLLSQLPTRRYTYYLFEDYQLLCNIESSYRYAAKQQSTTSALRAHTLVLEYFLDLPYDNIKGREYSAKEYRDMLARSVSELQRLAMTEFRDSLILLALSNHSSITTPEEMNSHLEGLPESDVFKLSSKLNLRTEYNSPDVPTVNSTFLRKCLIRKYRSTSPTSKRIFDTALLPNETHLFSSVWTMMAQLTKHLPLPKLTLQYLSVDDFLYRALQAHCAAAFLAIRADIASTIVRLAPQIAYPSREVRYNGSSNNALLINPPAILEVTAPSIEAPNRPGLVRAEVRLNLGELVSSNRSGWSSLQTGDVVFLVHLVASDDTSSSVPDITDVDFADKIGLKSIRTAIVESMLTSEGKPFQGSGRNISYESASQSNRVLRVFLDPVSFQADKEQGKLDEVYESLNLIIKRNPVKNKFLSVARGIEQCTKAKAGRIPDWFCDSFLGLGNPPQDEALTEICLNDTFIDATHAREYVACTSERDKPTDSEKEQSAAGYNKMTNASLKSILVERDLATTGKKAELIARLVENEPLTMHDAGSHASLSAKDDTGEIAVTLRPVQDDETHVDTNKKRKRGEIAAHYDPHIKFLPSKGPYDHNKRKRNSVRFTSSQIDCICRGTLPGVTLIDGVPGSGKTAVISQIISNIYLNEPGGRTLVLCKNEQSLQAIHARLSESNVDRLHLLGLLSLSESTLQPADVDHVLLRRRQLLAEVSRLASALKAPGDHGASCETADYFYETIVAPNLPSLASDEKGASLGSFETFFSNAARQGVGPSAAYITSCRTYIETMFLDLAQIRPFELLKTTELRQQFLLTKLAKIVLMTSDHAVTAQAELMAADISFTSIIIHQASSLDEIETFIPFTFMGQASSITRLVLSGDSRQIKPEGLQTQSVEISTNANRSLFSRLRRSGLPTSVLHEQGRCRESIVATYKHRYDQLASLATVHNHAYDNANAGLAHTSQFINVPDYKGRGEFASREAAWQNLGEAEYVVALYQYMRLLNYPAAGIALLTPCKSQKALIQDVLNARCKRSPIFGLPTLATVEEFQGRESDYVLLSLVRTNPHHDLLIPDTMTTALSRGKLGLYVFGRRSGMPTSLEPFLRPLDRATDGKLELVTGEMYPTNRAENTSAQAQTSTAAAVMEGVEHLGKYVYEMTRKRLESMAAATATK